MLRLLIPAAQACFKSFFIAAILRLNHLIWQPQEPTDVRVDVMPIPLGFVLAPAALGPERTIRSGEDKAPHG